MGAADSATQLIKFGKPESIGAIYKDRIGLGDVETVLDDRRGDHYVRFLADEFQHYAFKLFFAHLAVTHHNAGFWYQFLDQRCERVDRFDSIVDEIDLPFAR